jgi:hypothetical protein
MALVSEEKTLAGTDEAKPARPSCLRNRRRFKRIPEPEDKG